MKILIVDDDPISRRIINLGLRRAGWDTIEAPGGEEALALLLSSEPIVLTIIDIMMPDMDGMDLLARIRSSPALEQLLVIVCSANASPEKRAQAEAFQAAAFLPKPINVPLMQETVEELLEAEVRPLAPLSATLERLEVETEGYLTLLDTFLAALTSTVAELNAHACGEGVKCPCCPVSSLWGAAQSLGADRLSQVLEKQTHACQTGDTGTMQLLIPALQREGALVQFEASSIREEIELRKTTRQAGSIALGGRRGWRSAGRRHSGGSSKPLVAAASNDPVHSPVNPPRNADDSTKSPAPKTADIPAGRSEPTTVEP